ncbi:MAG: PKD domain-containing protein [Treponema sp.]|nr:PKD domain-containing protein [Treponema sp.]
MLLSLISCEKEDIKGKNVNTPDGGTELEIQPTAGFIYHLNASFKVSFQSNSKYAKSFSWNFGDGTTSPSENPEHTYMSIGKKTVTLTVYNGKKSDMAYAEIDMTGYITLQNKSSYPFSVKIDNESYKSLSGKTSRTYSVKPGSHTVNVEQESGYYLWATKKTFNPTCYPGNKTDCTYSFTDD